MAKKGMTPGKIGAGLFGISTLSTPSCLLIVFALSLAAAAGINLFGGPSTAFGVTPEGLNLSKVPPNFASLFTEAGQQAHVPPALVAAIYLTEHHTDTFGRDLKSLDQKLSPCKENSSGAAGPMQFIPGSWDGVTIHLKRIGITNPDRCKYRDSIIGAGFLLAGKVKYVHTCKKKGNQWQMTDQCISDWGQSYCGVGGCHDRNCGAPHYLYCEQVVRKYKLVAG